MQRCSICQIENPSAICDRCGRQLALVVAEISGLCALAVHRGVSPDDAWQRIGRGIGIYVAAMLVEIAPELAVRPEKEGQ